MATDATQGGERQARVISGPSAVGICIASMIGSGIFTVTGLIGPEVVTSSNLMIAWVVGGFVALCGGLAVAELAAMRPRASAQYEVVHEAMGPTFGYLKGMITLLVGYVSSLAAVALVSGEYVENLVPTLDPRMIATVFLVVLGAIHATTVLGGQRFNDLLVFFKVVLVLAFIVGGFLLIGDPLLPTPEMIEIARDTMPDSPIGTLPAAATAAEVDRHLRSAAGPSVFSGAIGLAIVSISFAYLGWATAAEVAGEIRRPGRNLPLAIIGSVVAVGSLYLLVNVVYVSTVPPAAMLVPSEDGSALEPMGDIGAVVAKHLLGERGGTFVTAALVFLFVSTLSTGLMTGGRIIAAMAWRNELPTAAGELNRRGAPTVAVAAMLVMTVPIVWSSTLASLFEYVGLLTTIAMMLAMVSVLVMRVKAPDMPRPFRIPLYPFPPLVSIGIGLWLVVSSALEDWEPVLYTMLTIVAIVLLRPVLVRPEPSKQSRSST